VQPTVSWHREEYDALGVDFRRRGAMLDEHLAAWKALWGPSPATYRGRRFDELEVVGGLRPTFPDADGPASLAQAAEAIPAQRAEGYTSFCFNPAQYVRTREEVPALCRELVARAADWG